MELVERLAAGDTRALARAISTAEENVQGAADVIRSAFPLTGKAVVLGVTGSPGTGKSTLVDALVAHYRGEGKKVGVVAVDPSSPYSGGAILGDRVRMQRHANDAGVFIRSMATRGQSGGLCNAAGDAVDLLDAAGYDPVLVETVGVGQDEIDVARAADVVAVVLVPGMGDDIQAIKAGILEIADLFVINKADRPGVDRMAADLEFMLSLAPSDGRPRPLVLKTVATRGEGIGELARGIGRFLETSGIAGRKERRRKRAETRFLALLGERLLGIVLQRALPPERLREVVTAIAERRTDHYTAVEDVMRIVEMQ